MFYRRICCRDRMMFRRRRQIFAQSKNSRHICESSWRLEGASLQYFVWPNLHIINITIFKIFIIIIIIYRDDGGSGDVDGGSDFGPLAKCGFQAISSKLQVFLLLLLVDFSNLLLPQTPSILTIKCYNPRCRTYSICQVPIQR